jgi:hypothetical protein
LVRSRCSPCGTPRRRRGSCQSRGVRHRWRFTSSLANPSHWSAPSRGPRSACRPGPGPSRAGGWLRPSSSGLTRSRVPSTVTLTGVQSCAAARAIEPAGARASLIPGIRVAHWSGWSRRALKLSERPPAFDGCLLVQQIRSRLPRRARCGPLVMGLEPSPRAWGRQGQVGGPDPVGAGRVVVAGRVCTQGPSIWEAPPRLA